MPKNIIIGKWNIRKIKIGESIRALAYEESSNMVYIGCEVGDKKILKEKFHSNIKIKENLTHKI